MKREMWPAAVVCRTDICWMGPKTTGCFCCSGTELTFRPAVYPAVTQPLMPGAQQLAGRASHRHHTVITPAKLIPQQDAGLLGRRVLCNFIHNCKGSEG